MIFAVSAIVIVTAFMLCRNMVSADKKRCGAAIVIMCGKDSTGLVRQVCAYHHDEQAGGGLYHRRIMLVSPNGEFCKEAMELAERFEDVSAVSAGELTELIMQGRL